MIPLYIMRHGLAAAPTHGVDDAQRLLTEEGEARVSARARALHAAHEPIACIFHSPYLRAARTAALVGEVYQLEPQAMKELEPNYAPDLVIAELTSLQVPTMLVSHLPLVDDLCSELTGKRVGFQSGTIVKIALDHLFGSDNEILTVYRS